MSTPPCANECQTAILDILRDHGGDANVSWLPPVIDSGYEPLNMHCPHGILWYAEPTSEQRAAWARDGAE